MKNQTIRQIGTYFLIATMMFAFVGCRKNVRYVSDYSYYDEDFNQSDADLNDSQNDTADSKTDKNTGKSSSSGSKQTGKNSSSSSSSDATVTIGISSEEAAKFDIWMKAFAKKYPNVKYKVVEVASSLYNITPKYTALAASGNLPDVIIGSENLPFIVQQGWAYPLDRLLNSDPDKGDALQAGLNRFKYNGHQYALPWRIQFAGVGVNLDLIDTLNMDKPDYNWNMDTFVSMAKQATTAEYSGLKSIYHEDRLSWALDTKLVSGMMPAGYDQYGYSFSTHTFNLKANNGWVNAMNIIRDLEKVPGCVAENLRDGTLTGQGKADNYQKKFGKNADAWVSGKVLFASYNTWELGYLERNLKYKWDLYPVPTASNVQQRIQTHVDFVFIASTVGQEKIQNAYTVAKFLSYDEAGSAAFLDYTESTYAEGDMSVVIPATANKKILNRFKNSKAIPKGVKYMYETVVNHPDQTLIADCDKVVPDYWLNVTQYRKDVKSKLSSGADPASLVENFQTLINNASTSSWNALLKKEQENLNKFYKSHPYEKQ